MAIAAAFALASGCAALAADDTKPSDPNPPVNPKIELARGDQWTYEVKDDIPVLLTTEIREVDESEHERIMNDPAGLDTGRP